MILNIFKHVVMLAILTSLLLTEWSIVAETFIVTCAVLLALALYVIGIEEHIKENLEILSKRVKDLWLLEKNLNSLKGLRATYITFTITDLLFIALLIYTNHIYTTFAWVGISAYYYTVRKINTDFVLELRNSLEGGK